MNKKLSQSDFDKGIAALLDAPLRVPVYVTHPKHKAHMEKHDPPVHGCRDCELAWSSLQRV